MTVTIKAKALEAFVADIFASAGCSKEEGTRIGRYVILRRLAAGGMAELYLARAEGIARFEKLVALKLVLPHLADDPEFVALVAKATKK